jgi:hypothetical protein
MGRFRSMLGTVSSNLVMSPAPRRPPVSPLRRSVEKTRSTTERRGLRDALAMDGEGQRSPPQDATSWWELPAEVREANARFMAEWSAREEGRYTRSRAFRRAKEITQQDAPALEKISPEERQRRREQDARARAELAGREPPPRLEPEHNISQDIALVRRDLEEALSALDRLWANLKVRDGAESQGQARRSESER